MTDIYSAGQAASGGGRITKIPTPIIQLRSPPALTSRDVESLERSTVKISDNTRLKVQQVYFESQAFGAPLLPQVSEEEIYI